MRQTRHREGASTHVLPAHQLPERGRCLRCRAGPPLWDARRSNGRERGTWKQTAGSIAARSGQPREVGSAIRSIAGFGWNCVFIEDRQQVWFGCDRAVRSEGRAAARRGKNEILCVPCPVGASHAFARVTVVTTHCTGTPVHRVNLARGPSQLIIIPDESCVDCAAEEWLRLGKEVEFAQLQIPVAEFPYHFPFIRNDRPG